MRLTITGTPDLSPDCTTPDTGEPPGTHNGQDYWAWVVGLRQWYLLFSVTWMKWIITDSADDDNQNAYWYLPDLVFPLPVPSDFLPLGGVGTVTVAEYVPPVATVLTNILLGSTVETCRILNSRIVRGPI